MAMNHEVVNGSEDWEASGDNTDGVFHIGPDAGFD